MANTAKQAQTKQAPPAPPTCSVCGKTLKRGKSVKAGMGHTCAKNAQAKTPTQWQAHYAKHTAASIPPGFVKLSTFKQIVPNNAHKIPGLNVNKVVTCIGRDKAAYPPKHKICTPIYVNGVRYVNPWLATQAGLTAIATGNYSQAPAK